MGDDLQVDRSSHCFFNQSPEQVTTDSPSVIRWVQCDIDQMQSVRMFVDNHPPDGSSLELDNPTIRAGEILAVASFLSEGLLLQKLGQHLGRQPQWREFRSMHSGIQLGQKCRICLLAGAASQARS
jgi:hypothetical protein